MTVITAISGFTTQNWRVACTEVKDITVGDVRYLQSFKLKIFARRHFGYAYEHVTLLVNGENMY